MAALAGAMYLAWPKGLVWCYVRLEDDLLPGAEEVTAPRHLHNSPHPRLHPPRLQLTDIQVSLASLSCYKTLVWLKRIICSRNIPFLQGTIAYFPQKPFHYAADGA